VFTTAPKPVMAAADQRGEIERHVLPDFDDGVLVHQHLLAKDDRLRNWLDLRPKTAGSTRPAASSRWCRCTAQAARWVQLSQVPQNTERQVTT